MLQRKADCHLQLFTPLHLLRMLAEAAAHLLPRYRPTPSCELCVYSVIPCAVIVTAMNCRQFK